MKKRTAAPSNTPAKRPARLNDKQLVSVSGGVSCDGDEEPLENFTRSFSKLSR